MFSQITGEFDQIEFAEYAAKRIRETVSGSKKISIRPNSAKFKNLARKNNEPVITNGEIFYLLPTAINSYNYQVKLHFYTHSTTSALYAILLRNW